MYCIFCGCICDYLKGDICPKCLEVIEKSNDRVRALALLKQAEEFCPVWLRQRIENFLEAQKHDERYCRNSCL